jgi:hypothetical protein
MKCGDLGFTTSLGAPCQQNVGRASKGCLWHSRSPEQRAVLAMKGGLASKMRRAKPADYVMAPWDDRAAVVRFAEDMARTALTEDVDPRRVDVALRAAGVALQGFAAETQEKLVDALLRLEHGGAAALLLERLSSGLASGRVRMLPKRTALQVVESDGGGPPEGDSA